VGWKSRQQRLEGLSVVWRIWMVMEKLAGSVGLSGSDLNRFLELVLLASDAQLSIMVRTLQEERKRRKQVSIPVVKVET
jgi:hypothetical protein